MDPSKTPQTHRIEDLIPHRDRMLCIEKVLEVDDNHCVTQTIASSRWPLCHEGLIDSIIAIELVAQTAAAYVGWNERHKSQKIGMGFIVGIKRTTLEIPYIAIGSKLRISCKKLMTMKNYAEFEGDVRDDLRTYSNVQLQLFRP